MALFFGSSFRREAMRCYEPPRCYSGQKDRRSRIARLILANRPSSVAASSIDRPESSNVFLNHVQMDPEPLQVDFKSPWKPERTHG